MLFEKQKNQLVTVFLILFLCFFMPCGVKKAEAFSDVPEESWYAGYVSQVCARGCMTGLNEEKFGPLETLPRAQLVSILYRIAGSPAITYESRFPDVPDGQFFSKAVTWAAKYGIVTGYENGNFGPTDPVTREQLAVFFYRMYNAIFGNVPIPGNAQSLFAGFADRSQISAFARIPLAWATNMYIITGWTGSDGQKYILPQGNASRAETASMLCRFFWQADRYGQEFSSEILFWNAYLPYAWNSLIHEDAVTLYHALGSDRKNITVAVNAGHGTPGGNKVYTYCHPDGTAKVTGGSTPKGSYTAAAVSSGMTFLDGTTEGDATLSLAIILKNRLLAAGYDVLMIRENTNTRLDNIARASLANRYADCHIAIHYNSTDYDAGFFYIDVPDVASYRKMEPVASHWQEHNALGNAVLNGMKAYGVKIRGKGTMDLDLTQTSYSTVPSVDVEVGDRASDHSYATQSILADAILRGVSLYFSK